MYIFALPGLVAWASTFQNVSLGSNSRCVAMSHGRFLQKRHLLTISQCNDKEKTLFSLTLSNVQLCEQFWYFVKSWKICFARFWNARSIWLFCKKIITTEASGKRVINDGIFCCAQTFFICLLERKICLFESCWNSWVWKFLTSRKPLVSRNHVDELDSGCVLRHQRTAVGFLPGHIQAFGGGQKLSKQGQWVGQLSVGKRQCVGNRGKGAVSGSRRQWAAISWWLLGYETRLFMALVS